MDAPSLVRQSRLDAGLTQVQLARALGMTQAAVARLERPGANPTIRTLERALGAAGHRLQLAASKAPPSVDEDQLRAHLALSPSERARRHDRAYRDTSRIARRARRLE